VHCVSCPVRICLANSHLETGCILTTTIQDVQNFTCPPCLVKQKKPMQVCFHFPISFIQLISTNQKYVILGWALRTISQSKAVGPLFYMPMRLSSFTGYFDNMTSMMLREEFRDDSQSVSGIHMTNQLPTLHSQIQSITLKLFVEPIRLIANPSLKRPLEKVILPGLQQVNHKGKVLITIDTHSVSGTGSLVFGGSQGAYRSAMVTEVSRN
jgi:hypothetical protein